METADFCVLVLYPATLPNSLISSSSFLVASLGFSICSIMLYVNSEFSFFLSNWDFFLIVIVRTSNTILNKSAENGHPCLVPDLRGNAFSFSPLSVLAVGLSCMAFII